MVTLTIDGQHVRVEGGTPILEVAKKLGIHIPTLCYHPALKPYGACRLCMVEVIKNKWSKLVTSCNYPAEDGLEVSTSSDRVKRIRRVLMEFLLARCPNVPVIRQLAERKGIRASRLKKIDDQRCILCGLCVRTCEEMVGVSAISFTNRGTDREVNTPFGIASDVCIGCGACTYICPTTCIEMVYNSDDAGGQSLHMGELALEACPHNHACDTCEMEQHFVEDMKSAVQELRKTS